jgi:hypothetical protein
MFYLFNNFLFFLIFYIFFFIFFFIIFILNHGKKNKLTLFFEKKIETCVFFSYFYGVLCFIFYFPILFMFWYILFRFFSLFFGFNFSFFSIVHAATDDSSMDGPMTKYNGYAIKKGIVIGLYSAAGFHLCRRLWYHYIPVKVRLPNGQYSSAYRTFGETRREIIMSTVFESANSAAFSTASGSIVYDIEKNKQSLGQAVINHKVPEAVDDGFRNIFSDKIGSDKIE